MNKIYVGFIWILCTLSCVPPSEEVITEVSINLEDERTRQIINWQNEQLIDSLYSALSDKNPTYRYLALRAFASIQEPNTVTNIYPLLNDPNMEVKSMAAYTLGQIGQLGAIDRLIAAFVPQDTLDVDNNLNGNILEALGKISGPKVLEQISSVATYKAEDTTLVMGQMKSIYQFGLRGIVNQTSVNRASLLATDKEYSDNIRLLAAHYLARNNDLNINAKQSNLLEVLKRDNNINIKMAVALAMKHFKDSPSFATELINQLDVEKDYRVKTYLLKALYNYPYPEVLETMKLHLLNSNIHVATTAAQFFYDKGLVGDAYNYRLLITETTPWQVKSILYKAVMKHTPLYYTKLKNDYAAEIQLLIEQAKSPYEKAAYIEALSADPYQYINLFNLLSTSSLPPVKTAVAAGLKNTVLNSDFIKAYGNNYIRVARHIADTLLIEAKKGNVGVVAQFAELLKSKDYNWNLMLKDSTWKESVLSSLKLPRDLEAYREMESAIASVEGREYKTKTPEVAQSIDWGIIDGLQDSANVVMKTTKGNITFKLYPKMAPASVANFIGLCNKDYYDGKVFHRVVPNFVIQGGCPIGDGYGSLDYTVRSEVPQMYYDNEGYLGMASAGKHTEGVQFFITHSPTPHLDGKYTIFGKVVSGMDVVHKIEIGDVIIDAILIK